MKRVIIERTRNVTRPYRHFPLILNAGVYVLKGRTVTFEAYSLFFSKKKTNKNKNKDIVLPTEKLTKLMVLY